MKKAIVTTLCAMMLSVGNAYAMSDWAKPEAEQANQYGLVTESILWGDVDADITREEFCYLAMNLYKNMGGKTAEIKENPFEDTENEAALEAYSLGIINGKTETKFYPDAPITRQEIAKIIMLTVNSVGDKDITGRDVCELCHFEDFSDIHSWATEYVEGAVRHDIITGVTRTRLFPQGNATREQAVVIMNRAYESFAEEKSQYEVPEISISQNFDSVKVSWQKIKDAEGYSLLIRDRDKNIVKSIKTTDNFLEISLDDLSYGEYSVILGARMGAYSYVFSEGKSFQKNPEEYVEKYPSQNDKINRVFPDGQAFSDYETAKANMTTVAVPVWKLDDAGNKYSSKMWVEVNSALGWDVVKIFTEIYNDAEKFPIKDIGGFSFRQTAMGGISEHSYGTCIDINWDENYYCYSDSGEAITGSFWKPYENPYSIPADGSVVRVFKKYGFKWGGDAWVKLKDYMHFTYLGR